jgi:hypothetical protein
MALPNDEELGDLSDVEVTNGERLKPRPLAEGEVELED